MIQSLLPQAILTAKRGKQIVPRAKYQNMIITETGVQTVTTDAGPTM